MIVPRLAHDAHRGRSGPHERRQGLVVVDSAAGPARGAEGHQGGVLELQLSRRAGEELFVLGVRAGPAALDPTDAQRVELASHFQLVLRRHRDALELDAVAQRGVEDLDALWPCRIACAFTHERCREPGCGVVSPASDVLMPASSLLDARQDRLGDLIGAHIGHGIVCNDCFARGAHPIGADGLAQELQHEHR